MLFSILRRGYRSNKETYENFGLHALSMMTAQHFWTFKKKHKFAPISETVSIERNWWTSWITCIVNNHSITFLNILKCKIFHLGMYMSFWRNNLVRYISIDKGIIGPRNFRSKLWLWIIMLQTKWCSYNSAFNPFLGGFIL